MSEKSKKTRRGRPPLTPKARKRALPVMFEPDQIAALEAISEAEGVSKGEIVRRAVQREINRLGRR